MQLLLKIGLVETIILLQYLTSILVRRTARYDRALLGMSLMEDEVSMNASEHYDLISIFLSVYWKSMLNVAVLVGDIATPIVHFLGSLFPWSWGFIVIDVSYRIKYRLLNCNASHIWVRSLSSDRKSSWTFYMLDCSIATVYHIQTLSFRS